MPSLLSPQTACCSNGSGGGGRLVPAMPGCVCPKDMGPFLFQASEMSEKIPHKMVAKFAASPNIGDHFC